MPPASMQSFDRSPMGGFIESPLGARGYPAGGRLYVAGEFTAPVAKMARLNDAGQWEALGAGVNSNVRMTEQFDGKLIAVGAFTSPGTRIADWDGTAWGTNYGTFGAQAESIVDVNGTLCAGGAMTSPITRAGYWDGAAWQTFGSGLSSNVFGWCLYTDGTSIVACGQFLGGFNRIARWNGSSWNQFTNGTNGGFNSDCNAVATYGGVLYAGGNFTTMGGSSPPSVTRIAYWDTGTSLFAQLASGSGANARVRCLLEYDGLLIIGGDFTTMNGASVGRIVSWNGSTFDDMDGGFSDGAVYTLAVSPDGTLYAGGSFATIATGSVASYQVATWNGSAWESFGPTAIGQRLGTGEVRSIEFFGD